MKHVVVFLLMMAVAIADASAATGIDPAKKYAYGENVGWLNTRPDTNNQLTIHFDGTSGYLSGFAWGENIGWICFPTNGFGGVTIGASGNLSGFAWGENVGWIRFPISGNGGVSINTTSGQFTGHAWGENIGWISFDSANHDVRTVAFDRQGQGTPNWWLDHHRVTETHDAGDGVPAWQKYAMDVSPTNAGNGLVITSVTNNGNARVTFTPASSRRYYTLMRSTNLAASSWTTVPSQSRVAGVGSAQTLTDTNASPSTHFSIRVEE